MRENESDAQRLGTLLPDVAHEIRNLMQSVQGLAELQLRVNSDSESAVRLNKISEQARFAGDLLEVLLHVSTTALHRTSGDVAEALKTVGSLFSTEFGHGIRIDSDVAPEIKRVTLPTGFLELIILNIVKNAIEALRSTPAPVIRISAQNTGDAVQLKIWNNGPPIPEHIRQQLFQQSVTTKPARVGHGIGLRLAGKLVDLAGGHTAVDNVQSGGVEFTITLPVGAPPSKVIFAPALPMRTLKGKRVLIIDDDPSVRDILAMMIKDLGGSVHTCNSGEDAIALTARNFDSVLLDMRMRGLSGQATYEQLAPELQSKVIFVTGDALNSVARKFIDSTSRPVLIKPVSVAKLSEAIAKVGAN